MAVFEHWVDQPRTCQFFAVAFGIDTLILMILGRLDEDQRCIILMRRSAEKFNALVFQNIVSMLDSHVVYFQYFFL